MGMQVSGVSRRSTSNADTSTLIADTFAHLEAHLDADAVQTFDEPLPILEAVAADQGPEPEVIATPLATAPTPAQQASDSD